MRELFIGLLAIGFICSVIGVVLWVMFGTSIGFIGRTVCGMFALTALFSLINYK